MKRTVLSFLTLLLACGTSSAQEYRPFADGVTYEFVAGVFSEQLLREEADRGLHDIQVFLGGSHRIGKKTWEIGRNAAGELTLTERFENDGAGEVSDEARAAAPATARSYRLESGDEMNSLQGDRGRGHEWIHLLPVNPVAGMEWRWNTASATWKTGKLSKQKAAEAGYNAHGKVVAVDAATNGSSGAREFSCVQIELTIDGVNSTWWWDAKAGLIRFGGDNLGLAREALEEGEATLGSDDGVLPMDRIIYFRL